LSTTWGLDLGESEIVAVRLAESDDGIELQDFAFAPIPTNPAGRGPAETRQALNELARRLHLRRGVVHAAGPGTTTVIRDEILGPEELDGTPETVRRHLLELLPGDLDGRDIRYEPRARSGDSLTYRLLSIPHEEVERSAELLAEVDLKRVSLQSGALALAEAAEHLLPKGRAFGLVDIGNRVTTLSVHRNGSVARYRIPTGEEDLAATVSSTEGISTAEAFERLAAPMDSPGADATAAALKTAVEALASDMARLLGYDQTRNDTEPPEAIYAIGAVATRPGVFGHLAAGEPLAVQRLPVPPEDVLRRSGRATRDEIETAYPRLLGAIGTGILGTRTDEQPLALRILPPAPEPVRIGLHLAASILLLALVAFSWMMTGREADRLVDLERRQQALDDRLPHGSPSPAEIAYEQNSVARRLDLLGRKEATIHALSGVDALYPRPREGQAYRLESLRLAGGRVDASLLVLLPPGSDVETAATEHGAAATDSIREICGCEAETSREFVPGGYRIIASWTVAIR
jgi:Tfp pilus assembly PilM family ATPase